MKEPQSHYLSLGIFCQFCSSMASKAVTFTATCHNTATCQEQSAEMGWIYGLLPAPWKARMSHMDGPDGCGQNLVTGWVLRCLEVVTSNENHEENPCYPTMSQYNPKGCHRPLCTPSRTQAVLVHHHLVDLAARDFAWGRSGSFSLSSAGRYAILASCLQRLEGSWRYYVCVI